MTSRGPSSSAGQGADASALSVEFYRAKDAASLPCPCLSALVAFGGGRCKALPTDCPTHKHSPRRLFFCFPPTPPGVLRPWRGGAAAQGRGGEGPAGAVRGAAHELLAVLTRGPDAQARGGRKKGRGERGMPYLALLFPVPFPASKPSRRRLLLPTLAPLPRFALSTRCTRGGPIEPTLTLTLSFTFTLPLADR